MKMSRLDRLLLLAMAFLAAYQIVVGIDKLSAAPITAYTIAFGVLLVAGLLMMILGFEVLDSPVVVIVSTIIPLSLSLGLVWQYLPAFGSAYLVFAILGLLAVSVTRSLAPSRILTTLTLAIVHGVAGLIIFLLPLVISVRGEVQPAFALVGLGGALIGLGGLLLSFLRAGKPILRRELTLRLLPALLLLTTTCFVTGFKLGG
jgi:hypothetical protein